MKNILLQEQSAPENQTSEETITDLLSRVLLFNDEWHSFEEVIAQIQKATRCSFEIARSLTFEVHVKGKAIVFEGSLIECLRVSSVLEEIALHTQILS
jgi:ATP-dependent Clp protease adapter protein ClpS